MNSLASGLHPSRGPALALVLLLTATSLSSRAADEGLKHDTDIPLSCQLEQLNYLLRVAESHRSVLMAALDAMTDARDAIAQTRSATDAASMQPQMDKEASEVQHTDHRIVDLRRQIMELRSLARVDRPLDASLCPITAMPVGALADAYEENESAAAARYRGHRVILSGEINRIGMIQGGMPYVVIGDKEGTPNRLWATFDPHATVARDQARFHAGDTIRVQCIVDGPDGQRLWVGDCTLPP